MTTQTQRRYPIDVMNEVLRQERSFGELAPVTVPSWVAMEVLKSLRRETQASGLSAEFSGRIDAVRRVLGESTVAALQEAGFPGELGDVLGQPCTVRLWPALADCSPLRQTMGSVRPIRLAGAHRYVAVTVQAGQPPRFIVDGQWTDEAGAGEAHTGSVTQVLGTLGKMMQRTGAATFLSTSSLQANSQWKGGSTYLEYAVVPAGLG
ncbi:hypothetical protein [Deinococcus sp. QL22]|uniref:hypothetical protein n=1 Tax=Deinococcus sp. QL22 TaxID=2939437 RepID=UPI0020175A00|nr:hypothetical protein [Deinococcus sp. QL22]UQN08768.1 hypothetical protein M1R55_21880 [Deinococcus sp. QL22]